MVNWTDGDPDVQWTNDICVYSTRASGGYTITATGAESAGGAFVMKDGAKTLPYNVMWNSGGAGNLRPDVRVPVVLQPGLSR